MSVRSVCESRPVLWKSRTNVGALSAGVSARALEISYNKVHEAMNVNDDLFSMFTSIKCSRPGKPNASGTVLGTEDAVSVPTTTIL